MPHYIFIRFLNEKKNSKLITMYKKELLEILILKQNKNRFLIIVQWRHFSASRFFVFVQIRFERKCLVTFLTHVRFLRRVGLQMCSQIRLVGERLATFSTLVRFFTCGKKWFHHLARLQPLYRIKHKPPAPIGVTRVENSCLSVTKNLVFVYNRVLPVCVRMCPCNSHGLEKHLPQ